MRQAELRADQGRGQTGMMEASAPWANTKARGWACPRREGPLLHLSCEAIKMTERRHSPAARLGLSQHRAL